MVKYVGVRFVGNGLRKWDGKETDVAVAVAVESFERSCGRSGWRKVVDLDFSNNSTDCPSNWTQD